MAQHSGRNTVLDGSQKDFRARTRGIDEEGNHAGSVKGIVSVRNKNRAFLSNFLRIFYTNHRAVVGRILRVPRFENPADDCLAPIPGDTSAIN